MRRILCQDNCFTFAEFQLQTKNGAHMLRTHVDGSSWGRVAGASEEHYVNQAAVHLGLSAVKCSAGDGF